MDSVLRDELRTLCEAQKDRLYDICGVRSPSERVDAFTIMFREILRRSSLCYVDGALHYFNGTCYAQIKMRDLVSGFGDLLVDLGVSPTDVRRIAEMPFSVIQERSFTHGPLICFTNGVLDLRKASELADVYERFLAWSGEKPQDPDSAGCFDSGFSPDKIVTECVPYEYDPRAGCPKWLAFLEEVLPDEDERKVLQEFFGMVYLDRDVISVEKFALLVGKGANGKSVIFEVIKKVLGAEYVSTMDSGQLTDEKMIPYLNGKRLNFAPDVRSSAAFDSALKALASGQDVTGRRIYGDAEKVKAPPLCFALNEMPRFKDATPAFFRRILLFSFDVVIPPERQDKRLVDKICAKDLPGIFNWLMEGRRRLERRKGEFTKCHRMEKNIVLLKRDVDDRLYPVLGFLARRGLSHEPTYPGQPFVLISRNEIVASFHGHLSAYSVTREMKALGVGCVRKKDMCYMVYEKENDL